MKEGKRKGREEASHSCISQHFQASVHIGWRDGTGMNESNKPRQAKMDGGTRRIIYRLRDDLPHYSV